MCCLLAEESVRELIDMIALLPFRLDSVRILIADSEVHREMKDLPSGLIIGISIGVVIGVILAILGLFCFRVHRKHSQIGNSSSRRAVTIPIRQNGADACTTLSDSSVGTESPKTTTQNGTSIWLGSLRKTNMVSATGIPEFSYKDLHRATYNFSTLIGQGAYGPVYKAQMPTGETVAVKVLGTDSKQGEKEFHTEVMLLGRLHHRNLVNLVGYCAEKGQYMLIYVYMSRGSLASHLYDEVLELLSWNLRVQIALDVARGLEYLHDGAVPPVIHRDIKSSNILLDQSMRARAAMTTDGKGGWEEIVDSRLNWKYDVQELNDVASLAYKCVNRVPKKRPSMRDAVQVLARILESRRGKEHHKQLAATPEEVSINVDHLDDRSPISGHRRVESVDSTTESC
nr:calcium/calmodulin-regulated receptor-like kinase 1 [Ipomoea batatas]